MCSHSTGALLKAIRNLWGILIKGITSSDLHCRKSTTSSAWNTDHQVFSSVWKATWMAIETIFTVNTGKHLQTKARTHTKKKKKKWLLSKERSQHLEVLSPLVCVSAVSYCGCGGGNCLSCCLFAYSFVLFLRAVCCSDMFPTNLIITHVWLSPNPEAFFIMFHSWKS
jgi:hypothetical protein